MTLRTAGNPIVRFGAIVLLCILANCGRVGAPSFDDSAREYVRLAVALGERDPDAVDYYYGPKDWVSDIRRSPPALTQIKSSAADAIGKLTRLSAIQLDDRVRQHFLLGQLRAIVARADSLLGIERTFDQEALAFFGIQLTPRADGRLKAARSELARLLKGKGRLVDRYATFDGKFQVPPERLPVVMDRAIKACRDQTLAHLTLPPDEKVMIEHVRNKAWSAYSYYRGDYHSTIQINTDLPLTVDRALRLACHEAYPGHHAFNVLADQQLVRARKRWEFSVQPTFSPQSLLSEAAATVAADFAFSNAERIRIERDVLFPLAGLKPADAERHVVVEQLVEALHPAALAIARDYLDGKLDFPRAATALEDQALMAHPEATLRYLNEYRTYVVTYTEGQDRLAQWLDSRAAQRHDSEGRWGAFRELTAAPDLFLAQ
jgi:hypothetical protein